jgi:hypothetical protein
VLVASGGTEDVVATATKEPIISGVDHLVAVVRAGVVADVVVSWPAVEEISGSRIRAGTGVAATVDLIVSPPAPYLVDTQPP